MRTLFAVFVMVSIGLAAFMMSASGFNALIGAEGGSAVDVGEGIQDTANNSTINGSDGKLEGSSVGSSDTTIIGMIFSGVGEVLRFAKIIVAMPMVLKDMGFPLWFSVPVGGTASIVASIGILQFVTGRIWR